jgi:S1-C subfamily serine protease
MAKKSAKEPEQDKTLISEEHQTGDVPVKGRGRKAKRARSQDDKQPKRWPGTAAILLVGALIGFCGLILGTAVGFRLGRLQTEAEVTAKTAAEERAFLGVGVFYVEDGALVYELYPDGPAEEAGLLVGDVITHVDGEPVGPEMPLQFTIEDYEPGDEARIAVLRGGERERFDVELSTTPLDFEAELLPFSGQPEFVQPRRPELGPGPVRPPDFGPPDRPPEFGPDQLPPEFFEEPSPFLGVFVEQASGGGLLILEVLPGSPAERAGLRAGDVIHSVNGERVSEFEQLREHVLHTGVGGLLELAIARGDRRMQISAMVGTEFPPSPPGFQGEVGYLGVGVEPFTIDTAERMDIPYPGRNGVLIVGVEPDSPAQRVGLRERDVIMMVDNDAVEEVDTFVHVIQSHRPGDVVNLLVFRESQDDFIDVEVALGGRPAFNTFPAPEFSEELQGFGALGDGSPASIELFVFPAGCPPGLDLESCL